MKLMPISETLNLHPNNVDVFMDVYKASLQYRGNPDIEFMMDRYDSIVDYQLTELHEQLNEGYTHGEINAGHPWKDVYALREEIVENLNDMIEMKIDLERREMYEILDYYQMFHLDEKDEFKYVPIAGIW